MTPTRKSSRKKREILVTSPYFKKEESRVEAVVKKEKKKDVKIIKEKDIKTINEEQDVPDNIDEDLKVLFVGINPGLASGAKRHHYAGPTNHFWPCLSESGLVDRKLTYQDDADLPTLYRLGFTNLTARTTRKASDLTLSEQRLGIPILNSKFETFRPRIACFIGKGIYEIYSGQKCNVMGLQDESHAIPWLDGKGKTLMFVMPSTSGIVSAYKKSDKLR
jgi:TDG/mug DNA glycosylase family protein